MEGGNGPAGARRGCGRGWARGEGRGCTDAKESAVGKVGMGAEWKRGNTKRGVGTRDNRRWEEEE